MSEYKIEVKKFLTKPSTLHLQNFADIYPVIETFTSKLINFLRLTNHIGIYQETTCKEDVVIKTCVARLNEFYYLALTLLKTKEEADSYGKKLSINCFINSYFEYCQSNKSELEILETLTAINIILFNSHEPNIKVRNSVPILFNKLEKQSLESKEKRDKFLNVFRNYDTVSFRAYCQEQVGYNYWQDLKAQNTIDTIDSGVVQIYNIFHHEESF